MRRRPPARGWRRTTPEEGLTGLLAQNSVASYAAARRPSDAKEAPEAPPKGKTRVARSSGGPFGSPLPSGVRVVVDIEPPMTRTSPGPTTVLGPSGGRRTDQRSGARVASQRRNVPSSPPEARRLPSG